MITAVDEEAVATPDDLATAIAEHRPGDEVTVTYERDGDDHDRPRHARRQAGRHRRLTSRRRR